MIRFQASRNCAWFSLFVFRLSKAAFLLIIQHHHSPPASYWNSLIQSITSITSPLSLKSCYPSLSVLLVLRATTQTLHATRTPRACSDGPLFGYPARICSPCVKEQYYWEKNKKRIIMMIVIVTAKLSRWALTEISQWIVFTVDWISKFISTTLKA